VLLDDEDAGADAADGELLVAIDLRRLGLHSLDPGGRRTFPEECGERLDRRPGALDVRQHRPVLTIAYPAEDPQLARPAEDGIAETDPLDPAPNYRPQGSLRFAHESEGDVGIYSIGFFRHGYERGDRSRS